MEYKENTDHTWPDLSGYVRISEHANPSGLGVVVSQTAWTAVVLRNDDNKMYLYGKSALTPVTDRDGKDNGRRNT